MRQTERTDPRRIVAEGYDRIAERYAEWVANEVIGEVAPPYVAFLIDNVPEHSRVLDLGCGGGGPTTRQLAERFEVTGVDISARQIDLSRKEVPGAKFLQADMTDVEFGASSFDAVTAFYSLTLLPFGELPNLVERICLWLRPGGLFVASLSSSPDEGTVVPDWLGAPMYSSGYSAAENWLIVERSGLQVVAAEEGTIQQNGEPATFLWMVARKPSEVPGA
ncbi:MAG TPA: methyltransferase domain-containing protein [Chloroflexota bacterium]|jgi:predicted TPR repeat methyltransferase